MGHSSVYRYPHLNRTNANGSATLFCNSARSASWTDVLFWKYLLESFFICSVVTKRFCVPKPLTTINWVAIMSWNVPEHSNCWGNENVNNAVLANSWTSLSEMKGHPWQGLEHHTGTKVSLSARLYDIMQDLGIRKAISTADWKPQWEKINPRERMLQES